MKFFTLLFISIGLSTTTFAQEIVSTSGTANDVYYSMSNGDVKATTNSDWDLAFEIKGFSGSILINDQKGVTLYSSPFAISDWVNFDTAGYAGWENPMNSLTTWSMGAFSQNPADQFDLGWGKYNISTHAVVGDSVFLVKLADGSFRKIYIKDLTAGVYSIAYANIDGTGEAVKKIQTADFSTENFGYFSFATGTSFSREPNTKTWDVVFTKYIEPIHIGGGKFQNYAVGGVKINKGVEVAQRNGMMVSSNDTSTLSWNKNITEIGSDWKQFDGSKYVFAADQVYFLRLVNGDVWKIYFTNYEGGSKGNYHFFKERIAGSSGVSEVNNAFASIFPNPALSHEAIQIPGGNVQQVIVTDFSGRTINSTFENGTLRLNDAAKGLYHVRLVGTNGTEVQTLVIH